MSTLEVWVYEARTHPPTQPIHLLLPHTTPPHAARRNRNTAPAAAGRRLGRRQPVRPPRPAPPGLPALARVARLPAGGGRRGGAGQLRGHRHYEARDTGAERAGARRCCGASWPCVACAVGWEKSSDGGPASSRVRPSCPRAGRRLRSGTWTTWAPWGPAWRATTSAAPNGTHGALRARHSLSLAIPHPQVLGGYEPRPEAPEAEAEGGAAEGENKKKKKKKKKPKVPQEEEEGELRPGSHADAVLGIAWNGARGAGERGIFCAAAAGGESVRGASVHGRPSLLMRRITALRFALQRSTGTSWRRRPRTRRSRRADTPPRGPDARSDGYAAAAQEREVEPPRCRCGTWPRARASTR